MFDILNIPMDDEKTFKLLQEGDTAGVFQVESVGMQQLLRSIKPTTFDEVIDIIALYRPSPLTIKGEDGLTMVERYIKVANGEIKPEYIHPDLEPILAPTKGQLIYQEQMMEIAGVFAGFTAGERDYLRKAMGKKLPEEMAKLKDKFIQGCVKNGYNKDLAVILWNWIEKGAKYLFNKSHSASYALVTYQTAYLKANHPVKFMASTMSAELQDEDKEDSKSKKLEEIAKYVEEAREMGIEVTAPLINSSAHEFTEVNGKILFALNAIRGVGTKAIKQIIENRPYANFEDFLSSNVFKGSEVKKGCIVGLIKAGAFDETDDRLEIMEYYQSKRPKKEREGKPLITEEDKLNPDSTKLRWEMEVLGLYLSGHPLDKYSFIPYDSVPQGAEATIGGEVTRVKEIKTKRGQLMCFLVLNTPEGNRDVTVFPAIYAKHKDKCKEGKMLIITGQKDVKNVLANRIKLV